MPRKPRKMTRRKNWKLKFCSYLRILLSALTKKTITDTTATRVWIWWIKLWKRKQSELPAYDLKRKKGSKGVGILVAWQIMWPLVYGHWREWPVITLQFCNQIRILEIWWLLGKWAIFGPILGQPVSVLGLNFFGLDVL